MITVHKSNAFKGGLSALIVSILLELILVRNWGQTLPLQQGVRCSFTKQYKFLTYIPVYQHGVIVKIIQLA